MKAKSFFIVGILIFSAALLVYIIFEGVKTQEKKIAALEQEISFLKEDLSPIRYKIVSKEDENIEISVKYYGRIKDKTKRS